MFPLRDDNPTLRRPWITPALIGANLAAWVLLQGLGSQTLLLGSLCSYGLIPAALLGSLPAGATVPLGAGAACEVGGLAATWLTPLSSMFMHGGWFHLLSNLWFLWVFGDNVEDAMGRGRFLVFYLLCGLAAAAAQVASNPGSAVPMVGASGAIGGVMGAYFALHPRARVHTLLFLGFFVTTVELPAAWMLGYWFLLQVLGGLPRLGATGGGVAFWAHAGGFLAGWLLVFPFRNPALVAAHRRRHGRRGRRAR